MKDPTVSVLELKLAIDKGANSFLVAALGPLNLILSPQSRLSYISCAMLDEDETKETSLKVFQHVVQMLQRCMGIDNILRIKDTILKLFVVNDLKMVGLLTDLYDDDCFCPFCTCPKEHRHYFHHDYPA